MIDINTLFASCKAQGFSVEYMADKLVTSIAECQRFIDKESRRNPQWRPKEMDDLLKSYGVHKAKLEAALETLEGQK